MNIQELIEQNPRMTGKQAADYLGLKESTLMTWRCRGGGPPFVKMGGAVRYLKSDLDAWIESRKVTFSAQVPR